MELHHSRATTKSLPSPIRRVLIVLVAMIALLLVLTVISGSIFEPPNIGGDHLHTLGPRPPALRVTEGNPRNHLLATTNVNAVVITEKDRQPASGSSKMSLAVPTSSPLHIGAFLNDPSLPSRCPDKSASLAELHQCPSLEYTDTLFASIRRRLSAAGQNDGGADVPSTAVSSLQMSVSPLEAVPSLRYAVTNGRTTADMKLYFTKDDDSNPGGGGSSQVTVPPKGAVHPAFEMYKNRALRGALIGPLADISKLVPLQKKHADMSDKAVKAGVLDDLWVGGHKSPNDAAVEIPSISHKVLELTRVFEFNGVHTKYHFDCVPDIDFRQYHQVRAASCIDHEQLYARAVEFAKHKSESDLAQIDASQFSSATSASLDNHDGEGVQLGAYFRPTTDLSASSDLATRIVPNYVGLFPIVDEEYFEYSFTLAVAHDAAVNGRRFTFIELGARYGTWLVRAAAAYRLFYTEAFGRSIPAANGDDSAPGSALSIPVEKLRLLAVEGNCPWFRKMEEHVRCNGFEPYSTLLLSYAAPISYNKVNPHLPDTFKQPRAVSIVQMVNHYVEIGKAAVAAGTEAMEDKGQPSIDMIDFDIQGFETISIEQEAGAVEALTDHVGFIHFGTHGTEVEATLLRILQPKGWCVVYFYAGAHTKALQKGHRCNTPYGSSVFNDGAMGIANMKFYKDAFRAAGGGEPTCPGILSTKPKKVAKTCYFSPQALTMIRRG